ncbi:MAG: hypothetical protein IPO83_19180 [Chitinophagaceae bacterium]|nr:hypothetical protein [Chitinophagaceae bacterium]
MRFSLLLFFTLLLLSACWLGCTKDAVETIHMDTTITNNDPPPYFGVSEVQINNYINRMYIDLIGRAPSQDEILTAHDYLISHDLSAAAKDTLIQQLISTRSYFNVLFSLTSADFINGSDSALIAYQIAVIKLIYHYDSLAGNTAILIFYQYELYRLQKLQDVTDAFMNGSISVNEYFAAFLDNYFYDQLNMGTENFVKAAFGDLLLRSPTQSELFNGVTMVDNNPAFLFQTDGDSKGDFVTIVTTNDEFYEGLVIKAYNQLLLRDATSQELTAGTIAMQVSKDYPAFQKELMKTAEYAGF